MSARGDGGPAFPRLKRIQAHGPNRGEAESDEGMSLRDWFAGKALGGLTSDPEWTPTDYAAATVKLAYEVADAMLAERKKEGDAS